MNIFKIVLFCFVIALPLVSTQTVYRTFSANIKISKDPAVIGTISGKLYYSASQDEKMISKRIDFSLGPMEYVFWNSSSPSPSIRYMRCGDTCTAETYNKAIEYLYVRSGDVSAGTASIDGRTCNRYNRNNVDGTAVQSLFVDSAGSLCRAIYGNGMQIDFSNNANGGLDGSTFQISSQWNCPQPVCNVQLDIIYVFDESGSISAPDFQTMKNFGMDLTNSFTVSSDAVQIGIVLFDTTAEQIIPVSNNRLSINNAMNASEQGMGRTCISCGLRTAISMFPASRGGVPVQRIVILMTDGISNEKRSDEASAVQTLQDMGAITFVIAVGSEIRESELKAIATTTPRAQTYWHTPGYQQIGSILSGITTQTCLKLPGSPCGANCRGFCACKGQCMCPDSCDDGNACTNDACSSANGFGCVYGNRTCNDNNFCTTDSCNPASGCVADPVDVPSFCDDADPCTSDICTSTLGCQHPDIKCDDKDPCTNDYCSPENGTCIYELIPECLCDTNVTQCEFVDHCTLSFCDPATGGCNSKNVTCDDGNICTVDSCDPSIGCVYTRKDCSDGNACTIDMCEPSEGGCISKPIDEKEYDDLNACTIDYCDTTTGIHHDPISCVDGDACTNDNVCESITGCVFKQKDCGAELSSQIDSQCKIALCNSNDTSGIGCFVGEAKGAKYDACGECFGHGLTCVSPTTISIGVVSAIVVGAVAAAAAIGLGSYKGIKYLKMANTPMAPATSNPLYSEEGVSQGENPMYVDARSVELPSVGDNLRGSAPS